MADDDGNQHKSPEHPQNISGMESTAANILLQAINFDKDRRYLEALACYREGIQILMGVMKSIQEDSKRLKIRTRVTEYIERAERLKILIEKEKTAGQFREQYQIKSDATGYNYEKIFGELIDDELSAVEVEDPYIRATHQLLNFLRFCELLVQRAKNLRQILLITGREENQSNAQNQEKALEDLKKSLKERKINLKIEFSSTLHDREIRFNNGWIVKIGRGLDIFKAVPKFSLGYLDMNLRPCHETTVDIFHKNAVKKL